ncbi:MAG: pyridoxine 5'-phosphate synthase [Desulfatibacillaceae bacterium]
MAGLAVNVDHVATIREARGVAYPDPVAAAVMVEMAGADGVVVHLRGDRRHIQPRDVRLIRQIVQTRLVLEMAPTQEMVGIALEVVPDQVTLVPERPDEITTMGGMDVAMHREQIEAAMASLHDARIPVSIFVDPEADQVKNAHKVNAQIIEVHTGGFCEARDPGRKTREFEKIVSTARLANKLGLGVHAGHGIDYQSIKAFVGVNEIEEYSIGHSIVSHAVFVGMERAVREMLDLVRSL